MLALICNRTSEGRTTLSRISAAFALVLLLGCGGIDLAPVPTTLTQLGGVWQLDVSASDDAAPSMRPDSTRRSRSGRMSTDAEIRRIRRGSGLDFVAHDFHILDATMLEIEQGKLSMGIAHRPGVYRDITFGERDRGLWTVRAGWQERDLVIQSKTKGIEVLERYRLLGDDYLSVEVRIQADGNDRSLVRAYRRIQLRKEP